MNFKKHIKTSLLVTSLMMMGVSGAFAKGASSDVRNLQYHTGEGMWFINPTLSTPLKHETKVHTNFGLQGEQPTQTTKFVNFDLDLKYGIAEDWVLGIGADYMFNHRLSDSTSTVVSKGVSNPTLSVEYRHVDNSDWQGDVNFAFTPNLSDRVDGTTTDIGDNPNNSYGHQLDLSVDYTNEVMDDGSVNVEPFLSYVMDGDATTKSINGGASTTTDTSFNVSSMFTYGAAVNYRHQISDFYAQVGVKVTGPYEFDVTGVTTTTTTSGATAAAVESNNETTHDVSLGYDPKIVIGYSFDKDMALDLGVNMHRYSKTATTFNKTSKATVAETKETYKNTTLALSFHKQF